MRSVYIQEHGNADKLIYGELPDPSPADGDVVVRVRACGLNHADLWIRRGLPFLEVKFPHILGGDIAGEVVSVGAAAHGVSPGGRVVLNPFVACGTCERCLSGIDNLCSRLEVLGEELPGGYAELVRVPAPNTVLLPEEISFEAAACIPGVFVTAWNMLFEQAKLQPGEWILIQAAGSGIGSAAIQLARLVGANVIATAGSDEKLEKAEALGARHLINYKEKDFLFQVRRLTGRRGVDVVIEHVGQEVWERSLLCLATGGRLVTCGATSGFQTTTDLRHVFFRNLQILGTKAGSQACLFKVLRLVQQGKLQPVLDRVFPLKEAARAHRFLEQRKQFGKLVLMPE